MKPLFFCFVVSSLACPVILALEPPRPIKPLAPRMDQLADTDSEKPSERAELPREKEAPAIELEIEPQQVKPKNVDKMPMVAAKPYMGLGMERLPDALAGHLGIDKNAAAMIRVIDPQGPAQASGLDQFDIITAVNGKNIQCHDCLCQLLEKHKPGDQVKVQYFHRGEKKETLIALSERPADEVFGVDDCAPQDPALPQDALRMLPQELRDAIEKNIQAMGQGVFPNAEFRVLPGGANAMPEIEKRLQKMMNGMDQLQIQPGDVKMKMAMKSMLATQDEQGKIEITREGDSAEARVYDQTGEVIWAGPYSTPQDHAAVPPPIRERLDKLNIEMGAEGGIKLKMLPRAK
jgi:hypothetical protein